MCLELVPIRIGLQRERESIDSSREELKAKLSALKVQVSSHCRELYDNLQVSSLALSVRVLSPRGAGGEGHTERVDRQLL